ncbi:nuclear transport factor 2 family protein [Polyangium sp. y55x31]|uniref:nuclear transport factor 2 family protein n=1 Tax=Polyangium sp. y55x31 TaxID=3042688 RepID=UPI0024831A11|nr:nuclear transport factor 2 family protein [Polyangium sp. y55x31]MDI1481496.1 nuclear transport factor 2 family protein [Polyangium sp. y55x31]
MEQIRHALQMRDVEALANLYAEDAVLEEVSSLNPPAHPIVVQGREAILKQLRDEFLRDPVGGWHREVKSTDIIDEMETDEAVAFTEVRTYAAGDKVITQHLAHKRNGRIQHDRLVVARDSD